MSTQPKFPNAYFPLEGQDGNAFGLIGGARRALRKAGATTEQIEEFSNEATSGDYDHVLQTIMAWVNTTDDLDDDEEFDL